MALAAAGLLNGVKTTCYPGFENKMPRANCTGSRIEVDGRIITGIGPGAALEFALRLVAELGRPDNARQLQQQMIVPLPQGLI